jgi:hypothetical protein
VSMTKTNAMARRAFSYAPHRLRVCAKRPPATGGPRGDWASEGAQMLETRSTAGEEVPLVCDNRNTHTKGAFYEAFEPDRARAYLRRLKFCYTPKHGRWLHVAACELSCLTSQCLREHRIGA